MLRALAATGVRRVTEAGTLLRRVVPDWAPPEDRYGQRAGEHADATARWPRRSQPGGPTPTPLVTPGSVAAGVGLSTYPKPLSPGTGNDASRPAERERVVYPTKEARELGILLRISRELDIVGDVTATVDNPSELLAWATIMSQPRILAWRAEDSGHCYIHVSADQHRAPIRGRVTAVLPCDEHPDFWTALGLDLAAGATQQLDPRDLSSAWDVMPIAPHADAADDPEQAPS